MEIYSHSSYADSADSSPRSREIDESQSWDEPQATNYKVKLMCSYNGKIQPRTHDNQLAYLGGDTKILAVDRNIKFSSIHNKLASLCGDSDICFKYQLPGEDLDALISVTNDEDLDHMMLEYDRLHRASAKPARLRLFLFGLNPQGSGFESNEVKSERQWFVDALNSVPEAPPVAPAGNPDFLFGLDKGFPVEVVTKDLSEEQQVNQQIQDLQRLQIAATRKIEETNANQVYAGEYYTQKLPDKIAPSPNTIPVPVQLPIPAAYIPERHMTTTTGYTVAAGGIEQQQLQQQQLQQQQQQQQQPVYLIPAGAGVYQAAGPALRPVTGQVGQGYYGMQRVVQEAYREQPAYNPTTVASNVGLYSEGLGIMQQPKVGMGEQQQGYLQVGYDSAGRQVYYTAAPYQAVMAGPVAVDGRQGGGGSGGAVNQDGKFVSSAAVNATKAPQTSSV